MPDIRNLFGRRNNQEDPAPEAPPRRAPRPGAPRPAASAGRPPPEPAAAAAEKERTQRRLDSIRKKREAESMMPVADSCLYQVHKRYRGFAPPATGDKYSLAVYIEGAQLPDPEQKLWLMGIERESRIKPQYNPPSRPGADTPERLVDAMNAACDAWEAASADAVCYCRVSADGLAAWIFVMPPVNGGAGPQEDELYALLEKQGVTFGIEHGRILEICQHDRCLMLVRVAAGQPPVHGIDGDVIDHFKRAAEIELIVKDDGTVDFRDLGWLQTVREGDVICDILPPAPPEDGIDVKSRPMPGRPGRRPIIPGGPGTRLIEGDTLLVAAIDGVVSFSSQRFRVEPLLVVQGDVDIAIGNLDVVGSVLVHGDILEGFEVRATGGITVRGMVEAATVAAGGSIQVGLGINGNNIGMVQAGGDVVSTFIESANVVAGGRVRCESIVNSVVFSDDAILANQGRGVIIGGAVTARNFIEANTLGNRSNRPLTVYLGNSAAFVQEKREMALRRDEVAGEIEEKEKNIRYLLAAGNRITAAEKAEIEDLKSGEQALKMQLTGLESRLVMMDRNQDNNPRCYLKAREVNPPVTLYIGGVEHTVVEALSDATFTHRGGEVIEQAERE